jgi:hypothetical protein
MGFRLELLDISNDYVLTVLHTLHITIGYTGSSQSVVLHKSLHDDICSVSVLRLLTAELFHCCSRAEKADSHPTNLILTTNWC